MWEISNSFQVLSFFRGLFLGSLLGFLYDFWRAVRKAKNFGTFSVFIQDFSYFLIISPIIFSYFLSLTNGEIRAFIFFAIIFGFFIYRATFSVIILKILLLFFKALFLVINRLKFWFYKIFDVFFSILKKILGFFVSFFEKIRKYGKKVLKRK